MLSRFIRPTLVGSLSTRVAAPAVSQTLRRARHVSSMASNQPPQGPSSTANSAGFKTFTRPSLLASTGPDPLKGATSTEPATATPLISIKINGREHKVPEGTTIYDACAKSHIFIPTLCYHPRLPPRGSCRVCLVQVAGANKLMPSCTTQVRDGMEVITDSAEVKDNVKAVLTMLRAEHPNDCMTCSSNGNCEFQDLIQRYHIPEASPLGTRMAGHKREHGHNPHGHTIIGRHAPDYYQQSFFESHEKDVPSPIGMQVDQPVFLQSPAIPKQKGPDGEFPESYYEAGITHEVDASSDAITRNMDKCIKCGRCVSACQHLQDMNILGFSQRGDHSHVTTPFSMPIDQTACVECGQCSSYCPVGAITYNSQVESVLRELESKRKVMIACTAPSTRVGIGEELYMGEGGNQEGRMVAGLKHIGFDYVFDTNFAADLTIMEEGSELINRLNNGGPFPMFTSCCPGWINLVEKKMPELIPNLSTARSPQGMMSSMVKHYFGKKIGVDPADICVVSVMPCTAKKHEGARKDFEFTDEQGRVVKETDYVLTTRELGHLFRLLHVPFPKLEPLHYDPVMGMGTGAAVIFGVTGGVMEAAARTAQIITGVENPAPLGALTPIRGLEGIKSAVLPVKNKEGVEVGVRVAVAHGGKNVKTLLSKMKNKELEFDFVEIMMCPGGCVGGGGQPKSKSRDIVTTRTSALYDMDERSTLRKSHENSEVLQLYEEFIGEPLGHKAHDYLHTHYHDRSGPGHQLCMPHDPEAHPHEHSAPHHGH